MVSASCFAGYPIRESFCFLPKLHEKQLGSLHDITSQVIAIAKKKYKVNQ
jgi:hypothetical protein